MTLKEWQDICRERLKKENLTSNSLFHDNEEAKKDRDKIYVPLALVERKKSEKREQDGLSPQQGTKLYEPQYEEKQRFAHDTFLKDILRQKQGKTQGKRIALIGEPGAGKTTLLQTIGSWILQQELGLPVWVSLADLTQGGNLRSFEDYLLNSWLPFSPDKRQKVQDNFTEQFQQERVWLLLDGVDEIATSGSQTLQNISGQLSGWVGKARVVLTCRLNVWQADVNALSDFETFRLLDFDYPQQVEQFIDKWFNPPQPPFERGGQEDPQPPLGRGGQEDPQLLLGRGEQEDPQPPFNPPQPPFERGGQEQASQPLERGEQEQALQPLERGENSKGDRLKVELGKEEKARVRDLVQNPLRLALLCQSWQLYEGGLPETKAELYGQFVEQFYRWKSDRFPIEKSKRQKLNQALGRLAKDDIDSSGGRFRLRQDFIVERLGDADNENSLFYLALQIGWLNNVGVAAESPTKKVYAFFHATFEEYFAALAIDDWDFFLPRAHKNKPVKGKRYRIFEPQWKQVILLWLGREDVEDEKKEEFIKALTEFKDGCGNLLISKKEKVDRGFYEYQAYFLAAAGIAEFSNCSKTDEIVEKIVDCRYNYSLDTVQAGTTVLFYTISESDTIAFMEKYYTNALIKLLESTSDDYTRIRIANSLGKIGTTNHDAINILLQLLESTSDDIRQQAANSLGTIATGNHNAIDSLLQLLELTSDRDIFRLAAASLGKIATGNKKAINALEQLLVSTSSEYICIQAAESLGEIDPGNPNAIGALVELLGSNSYPNTPKLAALSLEKIGVGNMSAIDAFVELLNSDYSTCKLAAESLGKIARGNQNAIDALVQLLRLTSDGETCRLAAESLGKIARGNQNAINALVRLLQLTSSESEFTPTCDVNCIPWQLQVIFLRNSSEYICIQAAASLWKIDPGNQNAINALMQLLASTSFEYIRIQAAESLWEINPGNQSAIDALVELLASTSSESIIHFRKLSFIVVSGELSEMSIRSQAVLSLEKIGAKNQKVIDALVQLLELTSDDDTYLQVAYSLGEIDPGNSKAIDALVQLLGSTSDDSIYWQAAYSLGKIDPGNKIATDALLQLLSSTLDNDIRIYAANSLHLGEILVEEQMEEVVTSLKDYLSAKSYRDNSDRFDECYKIIWNCAQTLPYPEFYQAWHPWHPPFRFKKHRWLFLLLCFLLGLVVVFVLA